MGSDEFLKHCVNFRPLREVVQERRKHGERELLKKLTLGLVDTYSKCSSGFGYSVNSAPRRVLTKLSKGVHNSGYDNAEHDYICRVGDKIVNPDGLYYEILERLGHGTFGQVLKCHQSGEGGQVVALKMIKNKPAYFHQALVEVRILRMLNKDFDPKDQNRIVRMLDFFVYRKHLCIVFELLSVNLYDVLKQNSFRGVSTALIRVLTEQLLRAMQCLREAYVIHCDLKPENVLLSNVQHTRIKLIDFGSACFENHTVYSYIQSRFYRSPEVLLGLPYTSAIDMWSLGCICAELFLGLPIFPGHSEYDQVCRIVEVLGIPPQGMLDVGKNTRRYFRRVEELEESAASSRDDRAGDPKSGGDGLHQLGATSTKAAGAAAPHTEAGEAEAGVADDHASPQSPHDGHASSFQPPLREKHGPSSREVDSTEEDAEGDDAPGRRGAASQHTVTQLGSEVVDGAVTQKQSLQKSGSLLDFLKRQLVLSCEEAGGAPEAEAGGEEAALAALGVAGGSTHADVRHGCRSDGSNLSTMAETSDATIPSHRQPVSSDDPGVHEDQSGLEAQDPGDQQQDLHSRRPRGRRRRTLWRLKTVEEYTSDEHKKEPVKKKYFSFKSLEEMIQLVPYKGNLSKRALREEQERRVCFLQFLGGVLEPNPNRRWTPLQASSHPFITGEHAQEWAPEVDPKPAPSFAEAAPPGRVATGEVPRLPAEGPFGAGARANGVVAGGSARTYNEKVSRQCGGAGAEAEPGGAVSAPATSRCPGATPRGPLRPGPAPSTSTAAAGVAPAAPGSGGTLGAAGGKGGDAESGKQGAPSASGAAGVWGPLCLGIALPDDNPNESYRPPIDKISEGFLRSVFTSQQRSLILAQKARSGAWSASTAASVCSSASSGSTPSGGHTRRGSSPYQAGSPLSGGAPRSGCRVMVSNHHPAGAPAVPASSPQVTAAAQTSTAAASSRPPGQPSHSHHGAQAGGAGHRPAVGSRDGSRGSSPWHLPSPMSELSTTSDRMNSSQPSGSDSCGENPLPQYEGAQCNFEGWEIEDPSQSDGVSQWPRSASDSDCTTPRSNDAPPQEDRAGPKDAQVAPRWENIPQLSRMQLSRGRLPWGDADTTHSPGSMASVGNFREKVGMNEGGPVTPFGHGARRDALTSMMQKEPSEAEASATGDGSGSQPRVTTPGIGARLARGGTSGGRLVRDRQGA